MEFCFWFGKQTGQRKGPARVRPGSGCTGLGSQRTTLVFIQGCGTDDVDYVLPSGHLRPPGHLHWLLGRDSFVSFIQPPLESAGWAVGMGDGSTEHHPTRGCEGTVL